MGDPASLAFDFVQRTGLPAAVLEALDPPALVEVIRATAHRSTGPLHARAIEESAAFTGHWLRIRGCGEWIPGPDPPSLVFWAHNPAANVQYYFPLFAAFADAGRTDFDGWGNLLAETVADVARKPPLARGALQFPTVRPGAFGPHVDSWLTDLVRRRSPIETLLILRECLACGRITSMHVAAAVESSPIEKEPSATAPAGFEVTVQRCFDVLEIPAPPCLCGGAEFANAFVADRAPATTGRTSVLTLLFVSATHSRLSLNRLAEDRAHIAPAA
ncbi:MAG: hypothetical protein ACYDDF_02655 [Thermoplasmatota archaeon]